MARLCIGNKDKRDDLREKSACNYNVPSGKTIDEYFRHIPNGRAEIIDNIRAKLDAVKSVREVSDKLRQLESLKRALNNVNVAKYISVSEMNAEIHKEINIAKEDECLQNALKNALKNAEIQLANDNAIKIAEEDERRKKDEIQLAIENSHKPFLSGSNWG